MFLALFFKVLHVLQIISAEWGAFILLSNSGDAKGLCIGYNLDFRTLVLKIIKKEVPNLLSHSPKSQGLLTLLKALCLLTLFFFPSLGFLWFERGLRKFPSWKIRVNYLHSWNGSKIGGWLEAIATDNICGISRARIYSSGPAGWIGQYMCNNKIRD